MTRIMTITSGLAGAGKTQLAINIALEQVRRGRQVGVFYARESASPIENLLQVQQPVNMLRLPGGRYYFLRYATAGVAPDRGGSACALYQGNGCPGWL